jgi:2-phosphosulfolactate phosphatase
VSKWGLRGGEALATAEIIIVVDVPELWPTTPRQSARHSICARSANSRRMARSDLPSRIGSVAAVAAFEQFRDRLREVLAGSVSGRELIEQGFTGDVESASEGDVSGTVPRLVGGSFGAVQRQQGKV